ncbi:YqjF family protein [Aeromicrobium sp.]|uniref:YqjF family protein n=1 Tax=Aeromicrobium sp. TaxID=1871063 RepID=UPI003C432CF8
MNTFDPVPPRLSGPRLMRQDWNRLTFVHWAVDPDLVAPLLPIGARPDVLDGVSYVGLIPFEMRRAGFGRGPAVPFLGDFAETNVRLYTVDDAGRHGVVFRSLETSRLLATLGARFAFGTPYMWARMRITQEADRIDYTTRRRWPGPRGAGGHIAVKIGDPILRPSKVEEFVTARFGLHTRWAGRTLWIPNHHAPWPLRSAAIEALDDSLVAAAGLPGVADRPPDSVVYSESVRTEFGTPVVVST